ncbi:uncharacterized protein LOC141631484 [Silene latifolia]|uniref:uncharacterized protein LOC141631484 n=1 Tax=Silene latifolia TaxID=37657 RepID=UPI003D7706D8
MVQGRARSSGKLFMMGKKAVAEEAHVVSGTFLVNFEPSYVLFDFAATHSFISSNNQAKTLELSYYKVIRDDVEIPLGKFIECNKLYKGIPIAIGDDMFLADLIGFHMGGFEVIMGMDWLGMNMAHIDCYQKKVSVRGPNGMRVTYKGFIVKRKVKFINLVTWKASVRKQCQLILCHVRGKRVEEPSANEIEVVSEFQDVFLEEIPGLPPQREVEFNVELIQGT